MFYHLFLFIFIFLFSSHRHGQAPVSGVSLRFTRPSVRVTVCVECSTFSPRTCLGRHIGLPLHFWCFLLFAWAGTSAGPKRYVFLFFTWAAKLADIKTLFYYCSIIHSSILRVLCEMFAPILIIRLPSVSNGSE